MEIISRHKNLKKVVTSSQKILNKIERHRIVHSQHSNGFTYGTPVVGCHIGSLPNGTKKKINLQQTEYVRCDLIV